MGLNHLLYRQQKAEMQAGQATCAPSQIAHWDMAHEYARQANELMEGAGGDARVVDPRRSTEPQS